MRCGQEENRKGSAARTDLDSVLVRNGVAAAIFSACHCDRGPAAAAPLLIACPLQYPMPRTTPMGLLCSAVSLDLVPDLSCLSPDKLCLSGLTVDAGI